jgi:hypothetical protein
VEATLTSAADKRAQLEDLGGYDLTDLEVYVLREL